MLRKFDVLDEDVARELLAGTERVRTLKTLWERMHNRLFHFYMDQLGTKTRASLYPGDGLDSKSVDGVIRKFDRNYFVSSGYDPSDADEDADHYHKWIPNFREWVSENNLILVYCDLRDGLPDHLAPVGYIDGSEVQVSDRSRKKAFRNDGIDLLIVKGLILGGDPSVDNVPPFVKLLDQLPRVLHPNALVAIHHAAYYDEVGEEPEDQIWTNESPHAVIKYYHPYFLQDVQGVQFTRQLDFELPENVATEMQKRIGKPFKYLNQCNPWFFYRVADVKVR